MENELVHSLSPKIVRRTKKLLTGSVDTCHETCCQSVVHYSTTDYFYRMDQYSTELKEATNKKAGFVPTNVPL